MAECNPIFFLVHHIFLIYFSRWIEAREKLCHRRLHPCSCSCCCCHHHRRRRCRPRACRHCQCSLRFLLCLNRTNVYTFHLIQNRIFIMQWIYLCWLFGFIKTWEKDWKRTVKDRFNSTYIYVCIMTDNRIQSIVAVSILFVHRIAVSNPSSSSDQIRARLLKVNCKTNLTRKTFWEFACQFWAQSSQPDNCRIVLPIFGVLN